MFLALGGFKPAWLYSPPRRRASTSAAQLLTGLAEPVALLQAGVGRVQANSFKSDSSMSAFLNFQVGGVGRKVRRLSWDMSVLCICQRVASPTKKGLWMKGLWTSSSYWRPLATQVCCGSLSERKSLPQPVISVPLVSRILGFINLKCSSACSLCLDINVFV